MSASKRGFTLVEIMIVTGITLFIIGAIVGISLVGEKTLRSGNDLAETVQNARIAFERISRDIRQAETLITVLPPDNTDPANPPPDELAFQDGNNPEALNYIRYYLNSINLQREVAYYAFPNNPATRVEFNATDAGGNSPVKYVTEDELIGEYLSTLEFWGNSLITVRTVWEKGDTSKVMQTTLFGRNLP